MRVCTRRYCTVPSDRAPLGGVDVTDSGVSQSDPTLNHGTSSRLYFLRMIQVPTRNPVSKSRHSLHPDLVLVALFALLETSPRTARAYGPRQGTPNAVRR